MRGKTIENEMVREHHARLNGHRFEEQALGDGEGRSLAALQSMVLQSQTQLAAEQQQQ